MRRYAAVLAPGAGQIGWVDVGTDGPIAAGTTPRGGRAAGWLCPATDAPPTSPARQRRHRRHRLRPRLARPRSSTAWSWGRAARCAALGGGGQRGARAGGRCARNDLMLVDTSSPLHPARSTPRPLPREVRDGHPIAIDLSPDGKLLAVATENGNQILLLDLGTPGARAGGGRSRPSRRTCARAFCATSRSRREATRCGCCRATRPAAPPRAAAHRAARGSHRGRRAEPGQGHASRARCPCPRPPPPRGWALAVRAPWSVARPSDCPPSGTRFISQAACARAAGRRCSRSATKRRRPRPLTGPDRFGRPDITFDGRWLLAPAMAADGAIRVLSAAADGRPAPAGSARPVSSVPALNGEAPVAARPVPELRVQP